MIDPVTAIQGVGTAISFASNVITYINDVKSARKDRNDLLEELKSTHDLLYRIKDQADQAHCDDNLIQSIKWLSTPKGPLEQFQGALEKLASKLEPVSGLKKVKKDLTWSLDKK